MDNLRQSLDAQLSSTYRIERELGGGGMSRVFVAEEIALKRQVVIKVLPPDLAASVSADRFRREILTAARLQHPHIVPLHSAGAGDGLLYFVMPYIEGHSLRERLAKGALAPADAVRIWRELLDGLSFAHANGIVHRDIKPENILVSGRHASITDFGVASAVHSATGEERVTAIGTVLGTPMYMSPEQASADWNIDHRTDIYSAGLVMYEMLAGAPPFKGLAPRELLLAHMATEPVALAKVQPLVPEALSALVMRCLAKEPGMRPPNADAVLAELDQIVTPTMISPVSGVVPARRSSRRLIAAGVAAALVVSAGSAWGVKSGRLFGPPTPPAHDSLRLRVVTASLSFDPADSTLATRVRDAALAEMDKDPWLFVVPANVVTQWAPFIGLPPAEMAKPDTIRKFARRIRTNAFLEFGVSRAGSGYVLTAEARGAERDNSLGVISEAASGAADLPKAMDRLGHALRERLVSERAKLPPTIGVGTIGDHPREAVEQLIEAYSEFDRRNFIGAARRALEATRVDSTMVDAWMVRRSALGNAGVAVHEQLEALAAAYRHRERERSPITRLRIVAAYAQARVDDAGGIAAYDSIARLIGDNAGGINNLANIYRDQRRNDLAVRVYRRSIDTSYKYIGLSNNNMVSVLLRMGRVDEAKSEVAKMMRSDSTQAVTLQARYNVATALKDWSESERLALVRVSGAKSDDERLGGITWLREAAVVQGRLASFDTLQRSRSEQLRTVGASGDYLAGELQRAIHHDRLGGDIARGRAIADSALAQVPWTSMRPLERPYGFLIQHYAAIGDIARGEEIARDWARNTPMEFRKRDSLAVLFARAELALAAGNGGEALRLFQAADRRGCIGCYFPRYARAYDAMGQRDSARVWFERFAESTEPNATINYALELAHAYVRLGEINEDRKANAAAIKWYEAFAALWATSDTPALQDKVREIRTRIDRLRRQTG